MADGTRKRLVNLPGLDWQRLRKRFRMKPQGPVTALHVTGGVLRVVQAAPRLNRPVITRVAAEPLDMPANADLSDPAVIGQAIARALGRMRLKPGPVIMGVTRASVVLRTLTLPFSRDQRELASMVHFQIGRDLPFPADDAVIDFKVRREVSAAPAAEAKPVSGAPGGPEKSEETVGGTRLEVLVAAVKREAVDFHRAMAEAAGLKLAALGLIPYANARCLEACQVAQGSEAVALVLLRAGEVSIDVIAEQSLLFSRDAAIKAKEEAASPPAPAPAADGAPAPEATAPPAPETPADFVTIEVVRSLTSFGGMEPSKTVAKVVVAGDSELEQAVVDALEKRLNIPVNLLDLARALDLPRAAHPHAPGALSALGLALGVYDPDGLPFDFLRPKRPAVQRDMRRVRMLMGAAAAVAAVMFLFAVRTQLLQRKDAVFAQINAEIQKEQKNRSLYRQMRQQAAVLQSWTGEARNWLDHYAYLSTILPASEEIYISSFTVNSQGTITLAVQARNGATLAKLDKQLRAAGYDVKPLAVNPGGDRYGYDFKSTVELTVPETLKIDLAKVKPPPPRPADDISLNAGGRSPRKGSGG